ncbi:protein of unknown function (DUF4129) [Goodfellowiella coeruleoviolacea]|uniref:Transglutaminase-like domain-containing protein n=1 Tax=Goodfellowiella coeruleoviolacea TaxID=334858 RepID=A0AAE3GJV9_9PSEU|nr:protein of unknown function (DUF4129) [Goodfellowiella coeruleoviolacea]
MAGLAVLCSSTALSGVVGGAVWLAYVALAVTVVVSAGLGLRALRLPTPLVAVGQLLALLCLAVAVFSNNGILLFGPGPEALDDLLSLLSQSLEEVRTGVPPVPASMALRCLIVVTLGVVAILVDTLAVAGAAPAACGLVLLCVFAVPASLADEMLPWWTFVCGASAFALLLGMDGQHRHRVWRGRWDRVSSAGSGRSATLVAGLALLVALVLGSSLTLVGTVGRLPGGPAGTAEDGLGIKPFTSLRGMLDQGQTQELFRVRGLTEQRYLRALTLREYVPGEGWQASDTVPEGVPAVGGLPVGPGEPRDGQITTVEIEPVGWNDFWLPLYGQPRALEGVDEGWRYDAGSGVLYSQQEKRPPTYVEHAVLAQPSAAELRTADTRGDIDPGYYQLTGLDPRVAQLAKDITKDQATQFDRVAALTRYFTDPANGFTYSTQTSEAQSQDALYDFLFNGKTGYCQQYASALGVLVRSLGIPARVAIGFTPGYASGDYRTITTDDAHAWVEVFFAGYGWTSFDPTPLLDGRGVTPPYLTTSASPSSATSAPSVSTSSRTSTAPQDQVSTANPTTVAPQAQGQQQGGTGGSLLGWALGVALVLAVAATVAEILFRRRGRAPAGPVWVWLGPVLLPVAVLCWDLVVVLALALVSWWVAVPVGVLGVVALPALLRLRQRRTRLASVSALGTDAATAAWQELLAESRDRGVVIAPTETVRTAARRLVREHRLDESGQHALRGIVEAVERSWYGGRPQPNAALPQAVAEVRASMARSAPLGVRDRILPRSVLPGPRS